MSYCGTRKLPGARAMLAAAIFAITLVTATALPQNASGEERSCRGKLGRVTMDNLRVPQRAVCVLNGTRVKGVITVQRDAILIANGVRVVGNVQAENARNVVVRRSSRVGGSIQLDHGARASVLASRVGGDIQVIAYSGRVVIARNVVNGNLECKENRLAPTGGRNVVGESKLDQCARL
jgi:hypothetical protein